MFHRIGCDSEEYTRELGGSNFVKKIFILSFTF